MGAARAPLEPARLCTYFDRNYLPQALALYRSLERHVEHFSLEMLCFDDRSRDLVQALRLLHARVVSPDDLLALEPRLERARADRSVVEFYYACTPWLVAQTLESRRAIEATYVDADMFFFSDIRSVYAEAPGAPVMIVEHASGDARAEAEHGRFNVCLLHFRSSDEGRSCLRWWGEATLASTRLGDGVWGDQKYLDEFPDRFRGTHVIRSSGAAPAPWNMAGARVDWRDGRLAVDGAPLVAYHYARFLPISDHFFVPVRREWLPRRALRNIYRPYMQAIRAALREIRGVDPSYRVGYTRRNLRGSILGMLAGRMFYEGPLGLRRVGVYVPSGRPEAIAIRRALAASRPASAS